MKIKKYILSLCLFGFIANSCTDLSETVYDQVTSENYYNTKMDVVRAVFRPFEHAYWSIGPRQVINEVSADQLGTWNRNGWWVDAGMWQRLHYHTWTADDVSPKTEWDGCFTGIMQANYVIDDLSTLDPASFGFSVDEFNNLKAQSRTLRAWFYIRLLDAFRNVPLAVSKDNSLNSEGQVEPIKIFEFVESELKDCIELLQVKTGTNGNSMNQGQWNKAGAAALLVRLYLNAEKWIGTAKYDECAQYAQDILDGKYGKYELGATWDEVFDWKNEYSNEVIFAFPGSFGYSHWHYDGDTYGWALPVNAHYYFGSVKQGGHNPKYALQPSLDLKGNSYNFTLGMPVSKFKKYPQDYRLKLYKNLGNSTREGMFLFGYLEYQENGQTKRVTSPVLGYDLYIRDQVGFFNDIAPGATPSDLTSDMLHGDHNSGWHFAKYPFYSDEDEGKRASDYVEIRLAEVYYSLAECKFRKGEKDAAAKLLNDVRKRNYPTTSHAAYLYKPGGTVELTENELIDEWGREFLAEGRRRTDLIRWNKFTTSTWWDKQPDANTYTEIFPISREVLNSNRHLVQNPGY